MIAVYRMLCVVCRQINEVRKESSVCVHLMILFYYFIMSFCCIIHFIMSYHLHSLLFYYTDYQLSNPLHFYSFFSILFYSSWIHAFNVVSLVLMSAREDVSVQDNQHVQDNQYVQDNQHVHDNQRVQDNKNVQDNQCTQDISQNFPQNISQNYKENSVALAVTESRNDTAENRNNTGEKSRNDMGENRNNTGKVREREQMQMKSDTYSSSLTIDVRDVRSSDGRPSTTNSPSKIKSTTNKFNTKGPEPSFDDYLDMILAEGDNDTNNNDEDIHKNGGKKIRLTPLNTTAKNKVKEKLKTFLVYKTNQVRSDKFLLRIQRLRSAKKMTEKMNDSNNNPDQLLDFFRDLKREDGFEFNCLLDDNSSQGGSGSGSGGGGNTGNIMGGNIIGSPLGSSMGSPVGNHRGGALGSPAIGSSAVVGESRRGSQSRAHTAIQAVTSSSIDLMSPAHSHEGNICS